MITKDEARKITNAVLKEREDKLNDKTKKYVEEDVSKVIKNEADKGKSEVMIRIPSDLNRDLAIEVIEQAGFKVTGQYGYNEYKISW